MLTSATGIELAYETGLIQPGDWETLPAGHYMVSLAAKKMGLAYFLGGERGL